MLILITLLGLSAAIVLVYLFLLVCPSPKDAPDSRLITDYAHRGLHGTDIPENSLAAFSRAVESGYGIELDVQLSRDGEIMAFHDYTLMRMTGREGKLSDFTADELASLSLAGTDEHIPMLSEVLELVNGRVPVLVELKGESMDTALCEPLAKMLSAYVGPYCIESFNPLLLKRMSELMPHVWRGLLYTNVVRDKKRVSVLNLALTAMITNFLARPNFIAYNFKDRKSIFVRICTHLYGTPRFSFTVCTSEEYGKGKANGECVIFESINP